MAAVLDASKLRLRALRSEAEGIVTLLSSPRALSDSRTTASDLVAAELGGAISESLFGVRRIGKVIGRSFSQQSRINQKRQLEASSRSRALGIVSQITFELNGLAGVVGERRRLVLLASLDSARSAARAITVARRCVGVIDRIDSLKLHQARPARPKVRESTPSSPSDFFVLRSLERELREFISARLSAIQPDWWECRIPEQVRKSAEHRKRQRDATWPWSPNEDLAPIHYVDFKDYSIVITDPQNWTDVFQSVFRDIDIIKAKLRELEPIRIDLAHSRSIASHDSLKLRLYSSELTSRMRGTSEP